MCLKYKVKFSIQFAECIKISDDFETVVNGLFLMNPEVLRYQSGMADWGFCLTRPSLTILN